MPRLFVAVNLPEEIKEKMASIQDLLGLPAAFVKWVEKRNFHLTLKFLGDVAERDLPALAKALASVASGFAPVKMKVRGFGAFPNLKRPRVLWVGVAAGGLAQIQQAIDGELGKLGFPEEKKKFSPHLTLGRIREGLEKEAGSYLGPAQTAPWQAEENSPGTVNITTFELMESKLSRSGPVYTVLGRFKLGEENI